MLFFGLSVCAIMGCSFLLVLFEENGRLRGGFIKFRSSSVVIKRIFTKREENMVLNFFIKVFCIFIHC